MKRYEVILEPRAQADLEAAYRRIARDSKRTADLWYRGCLSSIRTLQEFPGRCPLAPENDVFKAEIRHFCIVAAPGLIAFYSPSDPGKCTFFI